MSVDQYDYEVIPCSIGITQIIDTDYNDLILAVEYGLIQVITFNKIQKLIFSNL